MLHWPHENSHAAADASRRDRGAFGRPGQAHPGGLGWDQDRGAVAAPGRAATGVDRRGLGADAHELDPVDSWHQRDGAPCVTAQGPTGSPPAFDSAGPGGLGGPPGTVPPGVGASPRAMGWSHPGRASEAAVWDPAEGPAGPDVDASVGLPPETGQPCVPASSDQRGPTLPAGVKKNSPGWGPGRPSSSKMRPASRCIRVWAGAGRNGDTACGFPRPASTANGSISRGG